MQDTIKKVSPEKQEIIDNLHQETAKIAWAELQRFFAGQQWMNDDMISSPSDEQAAQWYKNEVVLWALVLNPWVLVQEI